MADVTPTAAEVQTTKTYLSKCKSGIAGEAINAGLIVYRKASDGEIYLADADDTAKMSSDMGIAVCSAAADQVVTYQTSGTATIGATAAQTAGTVLILSDTGGGVMSPIADAATGDYIAIIGQVNGSNQIEMPSGGIEYGTVAHA